MKLQSLAEFQSKVQPVPTVVGGGSSIGGRVRYSLSVRYPNDAEPRYTAQSGEHETWQAAMAEAYARLEHKLTVTA